jgi:rhodanese-related sulfurtransferase
MFQRMTPPMKTRIAVVLLGTAATAIPIVIAAVLLSSVPTVTPEAAKEMLQSHGTPAALVDVRNPERFVAGHLEGAVNWPLHEIAAGGPGRMPPALRDKTLLLVCDVGWASAQAAWELRNTPYLHALNVRGGIQEWMRSAPQRTGAANFPFRESPVWQQALAVLSYFIIKPIYMLLTLVVVAILWKCSAADLTALRWGMIAFFLGETACAVNYFGYKETSYLWEYLHSAGMFVSFGFLAYAILEALDDRLLGLSDPQRPCAALRLCGACAKHAAVPCGLKRTFYVLIPAVMVVAMMIPTADWRDTFYNMTIFGQPYNYGHLRVFQMVENWYCPAAGVVLLAASLVLMLLTPRNGSLHAAKIALAAGLGPLGFGLLRMLLGAAYDQNRVWVLFWEEATELLMVVGTLALLWIFRRGLFRREDLWFRELLV